jgi:hypothetical protein
MHGGAVLDHHAQKNITPLPEKSSQRLKVTQR